MAGVFPSNESRLSQHAMMAISALPIRVHVAGTSGPFTAAAMAEAWLES